MAESDIEWTDSTWNPTAGCSIISPGCTNCYAMRMAARLSAMGMDKYKGTTRKSGGKQKWTGQINLDERSLLAPLDWQKPRRIFVNSMSDLFHEGLGVEQISRVWDVMKDAYWHQFQILTKRSSRMQVLSHLLPKLDNVWIGVSVEAIDQAFRIDDLRASRAIVKFVSFEPLISSVSGASLSGIDWAIVGGESGPDCRPVQEEWVYEIYEEARRSSTAFFFKQWGGSRKKRAGRTFLGRTFDEFPRELTRMQPSASCNV